SPSESYLNVDKVIAAARKTGAQYIHPGYGFLSERPHFVEACEKAGITFVGPSAESMRLMGDKITARKTVESLGVPGVPGSKSAIQSPQEAIEFGRKVGFPILLKATAGGGGKGMRRVDQEKDVAAALEGASREALGAFGDGSMYLEKLVLKPHHVEIQVFGDGKGGVIHLGERECSIQRRHQKVWEESPSPILERFPKTREKMCEAAIRIAAHVKYAGAGTFEFIVNEDGDFYFLEMNTRLQVEHPVTEFVTGVDLVAWQLLLAAGEFTLPKIPERRGSSIEVRLYAEDPHHFLPAPGPIGQISLPSGPFTRVDTAFTGPGEVSLHYDPMIAKIAVWAPSRAEAIGRMRVALDETRVEPPKKSDGTAMGSLKTNLSFLKRLVRLPAVLEGDTPTDLIASHPALTDEVASGGSGVSTEAAIAASLYQLIEELEADSGPQGVEGNSSTWRSIARREGVRS
ncbi:MAG: ATP-grasp domain-containing protein, partial [Bdellovibrionales bacterium]|nr:ATP-grasp domain-containing protein [Bdellovibrionales bacterium]